MRKSLKRLTVSIVPQQNSIMCLKSGSHLPKNCVICLIESPLKMMKNVFYFILKALFVLKIFEFLLRHFNQNSLIRKIRLTSKLMAFIA